jgi:Domain of unknown function (DUF4381)
MAATTNSPGAPVAPDAATQAVLDQLHPLLQPAPPPWTPQTVGWAVLAMGLLLLLTWAAWRGWQRWHANRHRRLALAELRRLRAALQVPSTPAAQRVAAARRVPELVRRLALAHAPRAAVVPLQGVAWLAWLDHSLSDPNRPFTQGAGRHLADWAYLPESALPWDALDPLLALVERWVRQHRVPQAAA